MGAIATDSARDPSYGPRRALAFALTWLAYGTYYLGRKGFSVVKVRLGAELSLGDAALATIDTFYLSAYALGQFACGLLGDRIGARRLVGWGMLGCAAACFAFGRGSTAAWFTAIFLLNGFVQSTGWPGTIKAMAAWTTAENRGRVMGVWSTCYQFGGIAATALATWLLVHYGWRAAFTAPSIAIAAVGVVVLLFLPERPRAPRADDSNDNKTTTDTAAAASQNSDNATAVRDARARVIRDIRVWCYGVAYFTLKLIRYSLLFWLPSYLAKVAHFDEGRAGYLSIAFEVGGIAGSVIIGLASDRARRVPRALFATVSILGLAAALFLFGYVAPRSVLGTAAGLALIGFLLFGPDSLLSGAAAQDAGGPHAAATAAGIVNGVGSVGAILQGAVTVGVSRAFGWSALFYCFVLLALVGAAALTPAIFIRRRTDP